MASRAVEVSAFQAKTRLSELLRETATGKSFVIRRRGKVVARLLPPMQDDSTRPAKEILEAFRKVRKRIRGPIKVKTLIEADRRF
jgi:antitoxin (DNA-binding transcriptional repressor) of toxin-antitoxin stability system